MSKFTYKTKDGTKTGFIPGVGEIVDGEISSPVELESPNLELADAAPIVGTASQQNPNQPETAEGSSNAGVQG